MGNYMGIQKKDVICFNMDPKLLPHGGRKAPKGTVEQLKRIFDAAKFDEFSLGEMLHEVPLFSKAADDLQKINVDFENSVCGMLYWDGKTVRGFLPEYGNSFNPKTRTAFGSEEDSMKDPTGEYDVVIGRAPQKIWFNTLDDLRAFVGANMAEIVPNFTACVQAFSARVSASGELSDADVEKACRKMSKATEDFECATPYR